MSAKQMKEAIAARDEIVRHEEFPGNLMHKRDQELLDLYLDSDPAAPERLDFQSVVTYPRSPALVRRLLARGLDPNRPDWLGKTYLHACAENGVRSVAAVFLDAGADINARDLDFQGTPLAAAVRACGDGDAKQLRRRRRMVEFLLERGAATNLPGDEPCATPLAWASRRGYGDIVELLKRHGAR
jgi:ankyrin repeat protein